MTLSEGEILEILKMVEESSFGELRLEMGELKLLVRKKGYAPPGREMDGGPFTGPQPDGPQARQRTTQGPPPRSVDREPEKAGVDREGSVVIKSPMLGMAYRRANPESPPYVEVGSFVRRDDTVCLIEVMKVFTAVKAGVEGYVTEVLFESNEMVEYGQPLLWVRPGSEPAGKDG